MQALNAPAITRNDDKLAFVANVNGGLGNEIRIYRSTGPPPEATGDAANVPVDQCNLGPNSFESLRVSFAPDGQSLAYDAPDGIHLVTLTGWPSCSGITDKLIIPGGSEPYIGPANVGAGSAPPSSAFTISKRHIAADDTITLTLTSREAGRFSARATGVHKRRHHSPSRFGYGSGSARLTHAGMVRVTLKPTRSARLALRHSKRLLVTITVTFTSNGGSVRTTNTSLTVRARHP